jgi:radical SAM superfamily enzyme YgiQ (UPF0313 family)
MLANISMTTGTDSAMSSTQQSRDGKVLLIKPPFFTPSNPPLGISIIKAYLQNAGFTVQCVDHNVDQDLWTTHHAYFRALQRGSGESFSDGYSKFWWVMNAHLLAYANGAPSRECVRVIQAISPHYAINLDPRAIPELIDIIERFYRKLEGLVDSFDLSEYQCVGVSTYTTSLGPSLYTLRKIKNRYPKIKTVMGGGVFADDLASGSDNLTVLLDKYPFVDHIILGEGEMLLLHLLTGDLAGKRLLSIEDLNGATLDMKVLPAPDYSDFDMDNYYHLSIEGARSCPFQCTFCSETIQWGKYRMKPIDRFANQVVELARKHSNKSYLFGDSLMNPYLNRFAEALINTGANVQYDGYLRADQPVADRAKTQMWARSGLYRARLGVESAAPNVLKLMNKMTNPKTISEAVRSLAAAGVRTTTYWVVGFPGETDDDFEETLEFIRAHSSDIYELEGHPYWYYPYGQVGSRLFKSISLYPEEMTELLKFRIWDIPEVQPSREIRYSRLHRMAEVAFKLGLPNIYTLKERYEAEKRWHSLHPNARDI